MSAQLLPLSGQCCAATKRLLVVVALVGAASLLGLASADDASSTCSATTTRPGDFGSSGTIMSDRDGYGSTRYAQNEDCRWRIVCPADHVVAMLRLQIWLASGDSLTVLDGFTETLELARFPGVSTVRRVFALSSIVLRFVSTPESSTLWGFTFEYFCMPATCSAREFDFGNFTNGHNFSGVVEGAIRSDRDGLTGSTDSRSLYFPGEACAWNIHCDPSSFTALRVMLRLHTRDQFDFVSVTGAPGWVANASGMGVSANRLLELPPATGDAAVGFSSSPLSTSFRGFTLDFMCMPTRCSSTSAGPRTLEVRNVSGVFGSDLDGAGSAVHYFPLEECVWHVRCPPSHNYIILSVFGQLGSGDVFAITGNSLNATLFERDTGGLFAFSTITSDDDGANVTFVADHVSEGAGFTVEYICATQRCTSTSTIEEHLDVDGGSSGSSAPHGLISSDGDGAGTSSSYFAGEECGWSIVCPPSHPGGIVFAVWGRLGSDDDALWINTTLVDDDGGEGTQESFNPLLFASGGAAVAEQLPRTFWFTRGRARALVHFTTVGVGQGFTLRYRCLAPQRDGSGQCSSDNGTSAPFDAAAGVLISDIDGAGLEMPYFQEELCDFHIVCPSLVGGVAPTLMRFSTLLSRAIGDHLTIWKPNVTAINAVENGVSTLFMHVSDALVRFRSDSFGVLGGFTLAWRCMSQRCSSDTAGATLTQPTGRILSDQDGAGTAFTYTLMEQCSWEIRCLGGEPHIRLRVSVRTGTNSDYMWARYPGATSNFMRLSGSATDVEELAVGPNISVGFHVGTSWITSNSGGATIDYECINSTCSGPEETLVAVNGTVLSDPDGVGGGHRVALGDRCRNTIQCPDASFQYIAVSMQVQLSDRGNTMSIANEGWTEVIALTHIVTQPYDAVIRAQDGTPVSIWLNASAGVNAPNGYSLTWRCHRASRCPSISPIQQHASSWPAAVGVIAVANTRRHLSRSADDVCRWSGSCPVDAIGIFFHAAGSSGAYTPMWHLTNTTTSAAASGSSPSVVTQRGLPPSAVPVGIFAEAVTSFDLSFEAGFDVDQSYSLQWQWSCAMTRCQEPTSGTVTRWNASAGPSPLIRSPPLPPSVGYMSTGTVVGERCRWEVVCPEWQQVRLESFSASISGSRVAVFDETLATSGTALGLNATGRPQRRLLREFQESVPVISQMNLASHHVAIEQEGLTASFSTSNWLQFRFRCIPVSCAAEVAPASGQLLTDSEGTILSDRDGHESEHLVRPDQWCQWGIACPAGLPIILYTVVKAFAFASVPDRGTQLLLQSPVGEGFARPPVQLFSSTPTTIVNFSRAPLLVDFTTATVMERGFTMTYRCVLDQCLSVNRTSQYPGATLTAPVRLMSDDDGAGTGTTLTPGTSCAWRVACAEQEGGGGKKGGDTSELPLPLPLPLPSGPAPTTTYLRVTYIGSFSSNGAVVIDGLNLQKHRPRTTPESLFLSVDAAANVSINGVLASTAGEDAGVTLDFECHPARCDATHPPSGTAMRSASGGLLRTWNYSLSSSLTSNIGYSGNAQCTWFVFCPLDRPRTLRFSIAGSTADTSDRLLFDRLSESDSDRVVELSERVFSRSVSSATFTTSHRVWRVRFETDFFRSSGNGYEVSYSCDAAVAPPSTFAPMPTPAPVPGGPSGRAGPGGGAADTLGGGAIAGIVVGSLLGFAALGGTAVAFFVVCRRRHGVPNNMAGVDPVTGAPLPGAVFRLSNGDAAHMQSALTQAARLSVPTSTATAAAAATAAGGGGGRAMGLFHRGRKQASESRGGGSSHSKATPTQSSSDGGGGAEADGGEEEMQDVYDPFGAWNQQQQQQHQQRAWQQQQQESQAGTSGGAFAFPPSQIQWATFASAPPVMGFPVEPLGGGGGQYPSLPQQQQQQQYRY